MNESRAERTGVGSLVAVLASGSSGANAAHEDRQVTQSTAVGPEPRAVERIDRVERIGLLPRAEMIVHGAQHLPPRRGAFLIHAGRQFQIADLNALNAALAVIKWKKLCGFYQDFDEELHSVFTLDGNMLTNEDKP